MIQEYEWQYSNGCFNLSESALLKGKASKVNNEGYKRWLWEQMKEDWAEMDCLRMICSWLKDDDILSLAYYKKDKFKAEIIKKALIWMYQNNIDTIE